MAIVQQSKLMNSRTQGITFWERAKNDLIKNKILYLLVSPVILFYLLFNYAPMYGVIIAFQRFEPSLGLFSSDWVGLNNFIDFFNNIYFWRVLKNTLSISISSLVFGFPAPIILALLIYEITNKKFIKTVQTITYLPHFISLVVVAGLIKDFTSSNGIITQLFGMLGRDQSAMLTDKHLFLPIYVLSNIWQEVGWGSIIYFAALTGINTELYEACRIDGGGRIRQMWTVTLPGILPTIIILLILRMGGMLNVGYEKIILLYNETIYETADVISSFVYRVGLQQQNWSFATAVGLFNSVINIMLLVTANYISKRFTDSESTLW